MKLTGRRAGFQVALTIVVFFACADHTGRRDQKQFVNAIQNGDRAWAERILNSDPSLLHMRDRYQRSPVFLAAEALRNRAEMAAWLLEKGAEVDAAEMNGYTPLWWAARMGDSVLVDVLLRFDANVNVPDNRGETPLLVANQWKFPDVAMTLIRHGADVTVASREGVTPLHLAARNGDVELVTALLAAGADSRASDIAYQTPLQYAAEGGHDNVVAILMEHDPEMATPNLQAWTKLHDAAVNGDADEARRLLKQGMRVDPLTPIGRSPLHFAAELGHAGVARVLLEAGADPNRGENANNQTPLHLAARNGHVDVVRVLVDHGASLEVATRMGQSPLWIAAAMGHAGVVTLLLTRGADPNADPGRDEPTALQLAVFARRLDIAEALVSSNATLDIHSAAGMNRTNDLSEALAEDNHAIDRRLPGGDSPLHMAARCGAADAVDLLLRKGADVSSTDRMSRTPLHGAAQFGHAAVAQRLVAAGARVNFGPSVEGAPPDTPLHLAAGNAQPEMISLLLTLGADVNARAGGQELSSPVGTIRFGGGTPLHDAAAGPCTECVALLIKAGADVNAEDARGLTPFLWAVNSQRAGAAKLLIAAGADVNHRVGENIPLLIAAYNGDSTIVNLLVSHGADIRATNSHGSTALHRVVGYPDGGEPRGPMSPERVAVLDRLLRAGARVDAPGFLGDKPIHLASDKGYAIAVAHLLDMGSAVNARNESGGTPLHMAAQQGHREVADLLVSRGADVNARSRYSTPISLAVRFDHADIVALLIANGADVHTVDSHGATLLDEVLSDMRPWTPERRALAEMLIDAGVDINKGEGNQGTALHRAVVRGNVKMAGLLIEHGADPNTRDQYQHTPLHSAVQGNHLEIVELLIVNGADINPRDNRGNTPLYYAGSTGTGARIKALLRQHGGKGAFGEPRS